jgi:hypothetical protein
MVENLTGPSPAAFGNTTIIFFISKLFKFVENLTNQIQVRTSQHVYEL